MPAAGVQVPDAEAINQACQDVVADKKNHTRDLGGTATTKHMTEAVLSKLGA